MIIGFISCEQKKTEQGESKIDFSIDLMDNSEIEKEKGGDLKAQTSPTLKNKEDNLIDTSGVVPDFFNLSDSQFGQFKQDGSQWFISSDGKSRLYFVPYTDYSITTAILTEEEIKDPELVKLLQFEGVQISNPEKAIEIDQIVSKKGIKLGLTIEAVKEIFGVPDSLRREKGKKLMVWHFKMRESQSENKVGGLKPFIIEELEFVAEMEFFENRLTKVVYKYEVP